MATLDEIVRQARSYVGTPYLHQGRTRHGLDCAGLLVVVAHDLGLYPGVDHRSYGLLNDGSVVMDMAREHFVPQREATPGLIGIFRSGGASRHYGIFGDHPAGGLSLIHAFSKIRRVAEMRFDGFWEKRLVAVFSYKGVED